jgi:beta-phosphoglucomutase-like phosphatase (HAD superfamily)
MKKFLINGNIKALIFDCDGTLVDSMPLHMKAWEEAFKFFNVKYDYDFLYSLKGMKEIEIIELYNEKFRTNINPEEIVSKKHNYFKENINSVKPIESIVEIAGKYFGNLPLAVVSGSVQSIVHKELEVVGIHHLFKIILTADDPYKPKPAPDIFYAAANVSPEHCLVFEDGDPGLEAAVNGGMKTVDVREYNLPPIGQGFKKY